MVRLLLRGSRKILLTRVWRLDDCRDTPISPIKREGWSGNINSLQPSDAIWRHRSRLTLVQVMAYCLTASSHYLIQQTIILNDARWQFAEDNSTEITLDINTICFENYTFKNTAAPLWTNTETKMSSFWWKFHHWLHRKLSFWQLSVQPVMKISSKWWHFRFSVMR